MNNKPFELKFRVWHIPQVPGPAFHAEAKSYGEAVRMKNMLADYDSFQYDNNIKPDYCNANGIQVFQHDLDEQDLLEMELEDRWVDVEDEDDLNDYLEHLRSTGWEVV